MAVIRAKIGGTWVDVGGGGGSDEVAIGPTDPIATAPTTELWYDTDAPATLTNDLRWSTAWGFIGFGIHTANYQAPAAGNWYDVAGLSVTWTAVAGRRYKVTASTIAQKITAVGDMFIRLTDAAGGHLTGTAESTHVAGYGSMTLEYVESPPAGSVTRKVQFYCSTMGAQIAAGPAYPATILVEDIGPVTGATPVTPPSTSLMPRLFTVYGQGFTTSGTTEATAATLTIPAQTLAGTLLFTGTLYRTQGVGTDQFDTMLYGPTAALVGLTRSSGPPGEASATVVSQVCPIAAATAQAYTMKLRRYTGTGAATVYAVGYLNMLTALYVPDPI